MDRATYGLPDYDREAGSVLVYVKNITDYPVHIHDVLLDGVRMEEARQSGVVIWHRVQPRVLGAGEIGEIALRLDRRPGKASIPIRITTTDETSITCAVPIHPEPIRLGQIAGFFLSDEPDARDLTSAHPAGYIAQELVKEHNRVGRLAPRIPTTLITDTTHVPWNLLVYGLIADFFSPDCYTTVWLEKDPYYTFLHMTAAAYASTPRPMIAFLEAHERDAERRRISAGEIRLNASRTAEKRTPGRILSRYPSSDTCGDEV